jgi:SHS family lactate transporter-like MFS transporter
LKRQWNFGVTQRAVLNGVSMVGAILGGTLTGWLSDRWGRRRAIIAALVGATMAIPLWAYAPSLPLLFAGAFLIQFLVQGAWGVIPAHLSELSPDAVRGFLPGFGYQVGVLLSSPVAYVEASIAPHIGYANAMAGTAATVFLLAAVAAWLGHERRAVRFGETG